MIKSELITKMITKLHTIPEKDVTNAINLILDKIEATLMSGQRVEIRGFGSFSLHHRPARKAHNPKTGERLITQPKSTPHFKPGKEMRERINNSRHIPIKNDDNEDSE